MKYNIIDGKPKKYSVFINNIREGIFDSKKEAQDFANSRIVIIKG